MTKYKVGDKVCAKRLDQWTDGLVGEVIEADTDGTILVLFDADAAAGAGHGARLNEWWLGVTDVDPYEGTEPRKAPHGKQEYKGNGKHQWEDVASFTKRLRVPGGWLYRSDGSLAFVPVPEVVGYKV
jgi:hypothetical protein